MDDTVSYFVNKCLFVKSKFIFEPTSMDFLQLLAYITAAFRRAVKDKKQIHECCVNAKKLKEHTIEEFFFFFF